MPFAYFYHFSKRRNSTKRPSGNPSFYLHFNYKMPVSHTGAQIPNERVMDLHNLTISLSADINNGTEIGKKTVNVIEQYMYCRIDDKYYFIERMAKVLNDVVTLSIELDCLATYKEEILNVTALVEYSTSSYNGLITDKRMSMTNQLTIRSTREIIPKLTNNIENSTFVLECISSNPTKIGGTTAVYLLDRKDANTLAITLSNIPDEYSQSLRKFLNSPINAIVSMKYLPIIFDYTENGAVTLGNWNTENLCHIPSDFGWEPSQAYRLTVPRPYGDYRDYEPFTTATLYLPGVGELDFSLGDTQGYTNIDIDVYIDYKSGDIYYQVSTGAEISMNIPKILMTAKSNISTTIPIGGITNNVGQQTKSLVNMGISGAAIAGSGVAATMGASSLVAGGMLASGVGGFISSAVDYNIAKNTRTPSITGGSSGSVDLLASFLVNTKAITLTLFSKEASDTPASFRNIIGNPLFAVRQLSTLSGFVKCAGASVSINGYGIERDIINGHLNSGCYLE